MLGDPAELLRCVQEEEARLKPGTLKALAFAVIKQRGVTAPVSADDIVRITTTDGSRIDWPDKTKRHLSVVSAEAWAAASFLCLMSKQRRMAGSATTCDGPAPLHRSWREVVVVAVFLTAAVVAAAMSVWRWYMLPLRDAGAAGRVELHPCQ